MMDFDPIPFSLPVVALVLTGIWLNSHTEKKLTEGGCIYLPAYASIDDIH
jgi:hypothetical protein